MKNKKNVSLSLRKLMLSVLVAAPLATLPSPLWALPSSSSALSAVVSSTSGATVTYVNGNRVNVDATTTNSIVRWTEFGGGANTIGSSDLIAYTLPSASSSILNVVNTGASTINGTLTANGNLYILNPNGITVGATGVITANGIGLSTVPETEFFFTANGTLQGVENQNIATTAAVAVNSGATLTAASGTGNVWIFGNGATLAGTIDATNVTAKSVRTGSITLGSGGDLTVGSVAVRNSNLTVTTENGMIISSNNVFVWGPTTTLTAGGNNTITQTGLLQLGGGAGANATLTTNSGTGTQSFGGVQINGTGTLTVNATGGTVGITSAAGKLAVGGTTGALTVSAAGDLTFNGPKVTTLNATSTAGNITTSSAVDASGAIALTVAAARDINFTAKNALTALTITGATTGNVTLSSTTADVTVPGATYGALTVTAPAGNISLGGGITVANLASFNANKKVTLGQTVSAGNVSVTAGSDIAQSAALDTASTSGNVTYTSTGGNVAVTGTIGATTAPNLVTINSAGTVSLGAAVRAKSLTATAATDLSTTGTIDGPGAGNLVLTATAGNVSIGAAVGGTNAFGNITATAGKKVDVNFAVTATGNVAMTAGTDLTTAAAITSGAGTNKLTLAATAGNATIGAGLTGGNITVSAGAKIDVNGGINGATVATLNGTGNVTLTNTVQGPTVNVTGGYISESGAGIISSSGNATITSGSSAVLGGANVLNNLIIKSTPGNASVTETNGFTLANGTSATGNVSLTSGGAITLGAAAGDTITVAGNLAATGANLAGTTAIGDLSNNITVLGNLNLTATAGNIVIDGNATPAGSAIGLNHSFGQVSLTTTNEGATIYEKTTLNLGNVTLGTGALTAYSATSIVNTGLINSTGAILIGAGTAAAPGSITLDASGVTAGNSIGGTITLMNDLGLLGSTSTIGNYLASSLTVRNGVSNTALVNIPANVYQVGTTADIKLTAVGASNLGVSGVINTSGLLTLESDTGTITATTALNKFTKLTVNSNGTVNVGTDGDLTVNGLLAGGANTATFTAGQAADSVGTLTIGTFKSSNTGLITFAADSTKPVVDSVAGGISIFGASTYTGGSLSITNPGQSFGRVNVTTSSNGNATIIESGSLRLGAIALGTGRLSATSTNGDVFQDAATTITATGLVASASSGAVTLDQANVIAGTVSITSQNDAKLINTVHTSIGNTTVSAGQLTVDLSGTAAQRISQASGSTIYAYGNTILKTATTGSIVLDNTGNRFGQIQITTGGNVATIREATTVNLGATNTSGGTLTVTSTGGSIVDSGTIINTGTTVLSAAGDVILDSAANNFAVLGVTAGGNAAITDNVADLQLNASSITGSFTVNNNSGNLTQNATAGNALVVGGDVTLNMTAAASQITLDNDQNQFGALRFLVGTGTSTIVESTTMNLRAGSVATGQVTLNTGGNFVTSGSGASSFLSTTSPSLRIVAVGTITPGAGSLIVVNGLRVETNATIDLSGLDYVGNLYSKPVTHIGTGTYIKSVGEP